MKARIDYYKFTHYFFPYILFNFSETVIKQILKNKECFAEKLILGWDDIGIEEDYQRSDAPSLSFEIENIDESSTLIILKIPEARGVLEAPFIGIYFNKEYKVRYFTYEIAESYDENCYFLCEWTKEWHHINYNSNVKCDISIFIKEIKKIKDTNYIINI